jgi:hypothetical protein
MMTIITAFRAAEFFGTKGDSRTVFTKKLFKSSVGAAQFQVHCFYADCIERISISQSLTIALIGRRL